MGKRSDRGHGWPTIFWVRCGRFVAGGTGGGLADVRLGSERGLLCSFAVGGGGGEGGGGMAHRSVWVGQSVERWLHERRHDGKLHRVGGGAACLVQISRLGCRKAGIERPTADHGR